MVTLSRIVGDSSCEGEKGGEDEDDGDEGVVGGDGEVEGDTTSGDGEVEGDDVGGDGDGEGEGEGEGEVSDISCSFLLLKLAFSSLLLISLAGGVVVPPLFSPNM